MGSAAVVKVRALPAYDRVAPGGQVPVAVVFEMNPGWHIQTNDPIVPPELGDASFYIETEVKALPDSGSAARLHTDFIQWPPVHMAKVSFVGTPVEYGVFDGNAAAFVPVTIDGGARTGEHNIQLAVTYQACDDKVCLAPVTDQPVGLILRLASASDLAKTPASGLEPELFAPFDAAVWGALPTGRGVDLSQSVDFGLFGYDFSVNAGSRAGFALLLIVAALGGALLNFTPCVLPLIPIKVMSLQQAAGTRRRSLALGGVMSLGVVAFWLALGGLIAFVAGFSAVNQLFQYPAFTLGVGVVIGIMALGMMGRFTVNLPQAVYSVNPVRNTVSGSFIFGLLIAVLSTPCTAPFMGAAAAWATTQDSSVTLATFAAIGIGMALPYLVLSAVPQLLHRLPRTGPASQVVKDVMGLGMLAAAAYFLGVGLSGMMVDPPDPPSRLYWWVVALFVGAGGAWTAYKALELGRGRGTRIVFATVGTLTVAAAVFGAVRFTDRGPIDWTYYTHERFESAQATNQVVVMDFTAEWCLNCKALEESVLHDPRVAELLSAPGVVPIKVDLTGNNPEGSEMLKNTGRITIPLLIVYGEDGAPLFEGDFYTVEQVLDAVSRARGDGVATSG